MTSPNTNAQPHFHLGAGRDKIIAEFMGRRFAILQSPQLKRFRRGRHDRGR
jgi:hypothetical protein